MTLTLETNKGNKLLKALRAEGWRLASQYSPLAFDKGIDYDRYELELEGHQLLFEWTPWFEWELTGPDDLLCELQARSPHFFS